jgi:nitronate monooxygenase
MRPSRRGLLHDRLRLPVIAAPMFLVSGPEMVIAASRAGIAGSFPAANCRTSEELDGWLAAITAAIGNSDGAVDGAAPWGINLVAHRLNKRLAADLELAVRYKAPIVITSLGGPREVIEAVHGYGGLVFADVVSVEHARKAAALGVDGLVLVSAGAGGHTGLLSPFAFVPAVRAFWDGEIVVGGGIHTGSAVRAALALGADYAYVGTHFIASEESMAKPGYKQMLVDAEAGDIIVTDAFTGIRNSMLRPSIVAAGLDPDEIPPSARGKIDFDDPHNGAKAWRDIWSAGQGVGAIAQVEPIAAQVARMDAEYRAGAARA